MDKLKQKIKEGNKPKRPSWWSRNGYKVWRVILFPVYLWILGFRAFEDWMVKRQKLDDKKDDEILSAFLAKRAEVDEGCLWYCKEWHYYSIRVEGWLNIKYRYYLKAFRRTLMDKFVEILGSSHVRPDGGNRPVRRQMDKIYSGKNPVGG